jgi:hypothetical protein
MASSFHPPIEYLRECSDGSLRYFEVAKLEHVANLHRELRALWEQILEESAEALLARWMIDNRAELRSRRQATDPPLDLFGEPPVSCPWAGDCISRLPEAAEALPDEPPAPAVPRNGSKLLDRAPEERPGAAISSPAKDVYRRARTRRCSPRQTGSDAT